MQNPQLPTAIHRLRVSPLDPPRGRTSCYGAHPGLSCPATTANTNNPSTESDQAHLNQDVHVVAHVVLTDQESGARLADAISPAVAVDGNSEAENRWAAVTLTEARADDEGLVEDGAPVWEVAQ